jgi:transcriptional regulator with XRE-family HTH domain
MPEQDELSIPPVAALIKRARVGRHARRMSHAKAAALAGISETTWRHAERGSAPGKDGVLVPYNPAPDTYARMARAVGLSPAELRATGAAEAAEYLEEMLSHGAAPGASAKPSGELTAERKAAIGDQFVETIRRRKTTRRKPAEVPEKDEPGAAENGCAS